jgi:hypothetical protein
MSYAEEDPFGSRLGLVCELQSSEGHWQSQWHPGNQPFSHIRFKQSAAAASSGGP